MAEGLMEMAPPPTATALRGVRVLVLNRVWQPVNIVGIRRAIRLLCQGHADVIHSLDQNFQVMDAAEWIDYSLQSPPQPEEPVVRSIRMALRVPQVLLLKSYERVPIEEVRLTRKAIFERDGYRCQYCGEVFPESQLNIDHVIPRHLGGRTSWENLVTSCKSCNSKKANRLPHQAGFRLRRKPTRPRARPLVCRLMNGHTERAWEPFIGKMSS